MNNKFTVNVREAKWINALRLHDKLSLNVNFWPSFPSGSGIKNVIPFINILNAKWKEYTVIILHSFLTICTIMKAIVNNIIRIPYIPEIVLQIITAREWFFGDANSAKVKKVEFIDNVSILF